MNGNTEPIVVALGGNALKSGEHLLDYPDLPRTCRMLARHADDALVITHGNGPQIGHLAAGMSDSAYRTLDVLGAETEGMLGYAIEQELANQLQTEKNISTLLTRTEVDPADEDFRKPVKPIGAWLAKHEADALSGSLGWTFVERGGKYRRTVPSPRPIRTLQLDAIRTLIDAGHIVICAGGGGIPVYRNSEGRYRSVEAVIDKDLSSALLALELHARLLILATDVEGVYRNWKQRDQSLIEEVTPNELDALQLPEGSMQPKAAAAGSFVRATGRPAAIGSLARLDELIDLSCGTRIHSEQREAA